MSDQTSAVKPRITHVYAFTNGQTMVFDQFGKQMPEFQGQSAEVEPKIRAAGFSGDIAHGTWREVCLGWEERALKAEAALHEVIEDCEVDGHLGHAATAARRALGLPDS